MNPSSHNYDATGLHPELPGGQAPGQFTLEAEGIAFQAGSVRVVFPLHGLQLRWGGHKAKLIYVEHPDCPGWACYTKDPALLEAPALQDHPQVRALKAHKNKARLYVLGALAALVIGLWGLFALTGALSAMLAEQIPPEWEASFGKQMMESYRAENRLLESPELREALHALTDVLMQAAEEPLFPYHFYISDDPQVNAFALPGGHIVFNRGLLEKAAAAEEILGVAAHEAAHVSERHGLKQMFKAAGTYLLVQALFGDVSGVLAYAVDAAPLLLTQKYSRDFEREADNVGLEHLRRANIDPAGMVDFFEKLQEIHGASSESLNFLSTHPTTGERIAYLSERAAALENTEYRNLQEAFERLQKALAAAQNESKNHVE